MQANRQQTSWNPQIAIAVVVVGVLAAVWLNMAKLKMGMGQPQHDISQIPIAQNITSDEIEQLRNGKPLELILAERPDYEKLAANAPVRPTNPARGSALLSEPEAQTATALTSQPPEALNPTAADGSLRLPDRTPAAAPPTSPNADPKSGFRLPLRDPAVAPASFSEAKQSHDQRSPSPDDSHAAVAGQTEVAPSEVPRSNPSSGFGSGGGGSFLEKFPGHSQQLPNLKHGPAQNPPAPNLFHEPAAAPSNEIPTAAELTPLPFGDLTPAAPEQLTSEESVQTSTEPPTSEAVPQPAAFFAPDGTARPVSFAKQSSSPSVLVAPVKQAAPERPAHSIILTKPGETWWTLAQRVYDDGQLFRELYAYNRDEFPDYNVIPAGSKVACPPRELLLQHASGAAREQNQPAATTAPSYRTRDGETLFEIARGQLGQASRFAELLQMNRTRLPAGTGHLTPLPAGLELNLPPR